MERRKEMFDKFIATAKYYGWEGNTAMLWSAWKFSVWPTILEGLDHEQR